MAFHLARNARWCSPLKNCRNRSAAVVAFILLSTGCAFAEDARGPHSVVDMTGRTVEVPAPLTNIADLWFAHNALLVMFRCTDKISATVITPQMMPWMFKVAPALYKATRVDNATPSIEVLKRAGVQTAFLYNGSAILPSLDRMAIPAVQAGFHDLPTMLRAISLTAETLGTDEAKTIAQHYESELNAKITMLQQTLDAVKPEARPRVLHITSFEPLKIDGKNTIIDQWITTAGGRNAASLSGNLKQVSLEEIVALDPDVIIIGDNAKGFDPLTAGGLWSLIKAVREKRVYRNPIGVFPWDRYGPEFLLQILWAAKALHPELFAAIDMRAETLKFYNDFFGYALSAQDADLILAGKPPLVADFQTPKDGK